MTAAFGRLRWPALALVLAVGVSLTDWPLGWSFWVDHPLDAAIVAGLYWYLRYQDEAEIRDPSGRHDEAERDRAIERDAASRRC